jgi:uncharacterized membrane protein
VAKSGGVARFITVVFTVATLTYYLDPSSGRRRRARLTEQSGRAARRVASGTQRAGRDLANRLVGVSAKARSLFRTGSVEANVLVARVRSCLGRIVSHPGAIHVSLTEPDHVLLRGAVLAWEHDPLLRAVAAVPGVRGVKEQLDVHESAEHISALQGGRPRWAPPALGLRPHWSQGTRVAAAAAGSGLIFGGLSRRGMWGALTATAGSVLLLRSVLRPARAGSSERDRAVSVRKTLRIKAPVPQVFDAVRNCESFPVLMRHVQTVARQPDGSTSWKVTGPLGMAIEWQAVTTQLDQDRLLAWRTLENSPLQHSGLARFEPEEGGTRLQVDLWYQPPGGRLGHALAQLLGADPKSELDADLLRLKTYLETRRPARDAAALRTH